jgi:putative DNA primase/helicase
MGDLRGIAGDLAQILGTGWEPQEKRVDPPEVQVKEQMISAGLEPPDQIWIDGQLHRFASGTKGKPGAGDKSGWYILFGGQVPAGRFGDWRTDTSMTFIADIGRSLTDVENMANLRRVAEAQSLREAELKRKNEATATTVEAIWEGASLANESHPYLLRKGIGLHGARVSGDGRLIVPLFDESGGISSLQYIEGDGAKRYHTGGSTKAKYWSLGDPQGTIYIAEGFATAATIREATGDAVVIAYSASNLVPVTEVIRRKFESIEIVIVADNDASGVGLKYADQASAKHGARVVMPPDPGDANDYVQAGNDLKSLLKPVHDDWLVPADEFSAQPAPICWLIKNWVQESALVMVHGASGSGKTFVVLDWCLRMASGGGDWCGNKAKHSTVIYLAGEGHHGLKGRIAAWKHHNGVDKVDMWLSKGGCDLNTANGYSHVLHQINSVPRPSMIVVDTLHRHLDGDENSAQDAKTMLDACNKLMVEFDCTVLLVHHTGVSEEAQHRARGSSAWKGALENEISVQSKERIELVQRKMKDAELITEPTYMELQSVIIPGWFDEDGEPVSSAVLVPSEKPLSESIDNKLATFIKIVERCWFATGCEVNQDQPYISRSGLLDFLINNDGMKESTAKQMTKPADRSKLVGYLLNADVIQKMDNGWAVIDPALSSTMFMSAS